MQVSFSVDREGELIQKPLRVLVMADLGSPQQQASPFSLADAADFKTLLQQLAPQLHLEVPNTLGVGPETHELRLSFLELGDMTPAGLIREVPALKHAQELVAHLHAVVHGEESLSTLASVLERFSGVPAFQEAIQLCRDVLGAEDKLGRSSKPGVPAPAASAPAAAPENKAVDRILELVSVPEQEQRARSVMGKVIGSIGAKGQVKSSTPPQVRQAMELAARALGRQLDQILHHPEFQQLEAAWRGLKFLVDRTQFREGIRLEVLHLPLADLRRGGGEQIEIYRQQDGAGGISVILAPYALSNPSIDAELIQTLGERAASIGAPLLFSLGGGFFGMDESADAHELRAPYHLFEEPQYTKWNSLRGKPAARWLCPAFNRFLLRAPYTPGQRRKQGKRVIYQEGIEHPSSMLWGDPVWAIASLITGSFAALKWPTEISGTGAGKMEDLPIWTTAEEIQIPLEVFLAQETIQDLARCGIAALFSPADGDVAYLLHAPTLWRDERRAAPIGSARSIGLAYQLMASRVAHAVDQARAEVGTASSAEEVSRLLEGRLYELLGDTGSGASVTAKVQAEDGRWKVALKLRTGKAILGGTHLELEFLL